MGETFFNLQTFLKEHVPGLPCKIVRVKNRFLQTCGESAYADILCNVQIGEPGRPLDKTQIMSMRNKSDYKKGDPVEVQLDDGKWYDAFIEEMGSDVVDHDEEGANVEEIPFKLSFDEEEFKKWNIKATQRLPYKEMEKVSNAKHQLRERDMWFKADKVRARSAFQDEDLDFTPGTIVEIQLHHKKFHQLKKAGHKVYSKFRGVPGLDELVKSIAESKRRRRLVDSPMKTVSNTAIMGKRATQAPKKLRVVKTMPLGSKDASMETVSNTAIMGKRATQAPQAPKNTENNIGGPEAPMASTSYFTYDGLCKLLHENKVTLAAGAAVAASLSLWWNKSNPRRRLPSIYGTPLAELTAVSTPQESRHRRLTTSQRATNQLLREVERASMAGRR